MRKNSKFVKIFLQRRTTFPLHVLFIEIYVSYKLYTGFYLLGGRGEASPPKTSFTEKKNLLLFQIKIFFDDDFKESVKVTNVQKCDFSQS